MALLPVQEALDRILAGVKPLPAETVALHAALGRNLAKPARARRNQPPFAASAMDGYAVRHRDVATVPVDLQIIGTSAAGHGFRGKVKPGTAVRILTGAPVPAGADTVIIQENTRHEGAKLRVLASAVAGKNIRPAGLDFQKGTSALAPGQQLRPRDIGLLAAMNHPDVAVHRRPRVVLFTTGDELVLPGQPLRADQIVSSNSHALEAMVRQYGGEVVNLGIVPDSLKATKAAVRKGLAADILLTTGGASVGDHDYVQEAFKACGVRISFWKIALRPGKPFMYGRKGKTHVMGLPGNPVSALITARIFLRPLMQRFVGATAQEQPATAILGVDLPTNDERQDFMRARLETRPDGSRLVTPFSRQDSSMQLTMQQSGALIIRPPHAPEASAGDSVSVLLIDF